MRTRQRSRKTVAWLSTLALVSALLGAVVVPVASAQVVYPNLVKVFDPDIVGPGSSTTLTFTISNSGGASPVDNIAFTDTLPGDLVIATPSSASSDCDGILTAVDGGTTISLSGGKVGTGMECTITVNITSGATQDDPAHTNTTSSLTWGTAGTGSAASDDLEVSGSRPGFTKVFSPSSIGVGDTSTLTFNIDNSDNGSDIHSMDFTDELPDDVVIATPANAATTCFGAGGGFLTANPGTSFVSINAGGSASFPSLDEGASCTIDVDVIGASPGTYDNVTNELFVDTSSLTNASAGFATAALEVTLDEPPIDIQKTPDSQTILVGGDATWTIEVTNTGRFDLTGVEVTDALAPGCDRVIGALAVDATVTYSCSLAGVTVGFTNVAAVTGTDGETTANDSDDAKVVVVPAGLSIEKTPAVQTIDVGGTAVFTIKVSNTSGVVLEDVVVSDPLAPDCDRTLDLAVGAVVSYSCTLTGVTDDFINSATVSWTDPLPPNSTPVEAPTAAAPAGISMVKSPNEQNIPLGGTASWTITVFNTGVPSVDVTVDDPVAPDCDNDLGTLGREESVSYTCTLDNVTGSFTNTANAEATLTPGGSLTADATASDSADVIVELTDTDTATVNVRQAEIDIKKDPNTQEVMSGGTAEWTITVTNTGRDDLTGVEVSDPLAPDCDLVIGTLAEGEIVSYTCELGDVTGTFVNVATVVADDAEGGTLQVSDDASVTVPGPDIEIVKTPDSQVVVTGGAATFTIVVTNTGDVDLAGVEVSDPLAPDCDRVIGLLLAGDFFSYDCTVSPVNADLTNTASVEGFVIPTFPRPELGTGSIEIDKAPDSQVISSGGTASWTITVTNVSGSLFPLAVVVTDPVASDCDSTLTGGFAIGEAKSYTCELTGVTAALVNTATASGHDSDSAAVVIAGTPDVTDSDSAFVEVEDPSVDIQKLPNSQTVQPGGTANWTIRVSNTSRVQLTNVQVTDLLASNCNNVIGNLPVGGFTSYQCSLSGITSDFVNVAQVSATSGPVTVGDEDNGAVVVETSGLDIDKTPDDQTIDPGGTADFTITVRNTGTATLTDVEVSDPAAPDCDQVIGTLAPGAAVDYDCSLENVTAAFVNVATARAAGPGPEVIEVSDDANVNLQASEVSITKLPNFQSIPDGGTAAFAIVVRNVGRGTLTNVVVSDPLATDCDATFPSLAEGEVQSYLCELTGVTESFVNVATVAANDDAGEPVGHSDTATVAVPRDLEIIKSPDSQVVVTGGTAVWTITVINGGNVELTEVEVSDTLAPDCDNVIGTMAPDTAVSYECTLDDVTEDFTNEAAVTGEGDGVTLDDEDDADVKVDDPSVAITKSPDTQTVPAGGTATFGITVTNSSRVALEDVKVTDPLAPNCDQVIGDLGPAAFFTYTCTFDPVTADFTNVASVEATSGGITVGDADTADVVVVAPGLEIEKTPDTQTINAGDTATWTITVKNTGTETITGIATDDPIEPSCDATIGTLLPSETATYSCDADNVTESFVNVISVSGNPGAGEVEFFDEDSAEVIVRAEEIDIQKDPALQLVDPGDTATFTITVTNTGRGDLTDVSVSDLLAPDCNADIGTLPEGDSVAYTCELTGVAESFVNVATVTALNASSEPVSDEDDAEVQVSGPEITITKEPAVQWLLGGESASWVITVTNSGDEDLTDVAVADGLAPDCARDIGDLGIENFASYSCTLDNVQGTFTNVATASGNHASGGGGTVTDASSALVIVPKCDGVNVTILGTVGDDVIFGTEGDDVIWGEKGDDRIFGLGGNDIICGGRGNDRIAGNAGDDRILGGSGTDTAAYNTSPGPVTVNLGADTATGADGTDVVRSIENAIGSAFDDDIKGDSRDNVLRGGAGDDVLNGKMGDDTLLGQSGNDRLNGGLGDDYMSGASGQDWGVYITAPIGVRVDLRVFGPQLTRYGRDTLLNIEHLVGSGKNDILGGNSKANDLFGSKGRDFLLGRSGDDLLVGNAGIDTAFGAAGTDTCSAEFAINCEL